MACFGSIPVAGMASEDGLAWRHATALIGAPDYQPGFAHFKYVNPDAPKGGTARQANDGTFDNLNFVIPKGTTPEGLGRLYDTLMVSSLDEASSMYGLLAEALKYPDDFAWVSFRLRQGAKWHDGQPVTPEDVVWSFNALTKHNPQQAFYYRHVKKVEKTGPREVTFTFDAPGNRELPHIAGQVLVMPKHWWLGVDGKGRQRDIASGTLEPPLGSGAYRIKALNAGRSITYQRVPDYWARDLNVNIGQHNFDQLHYEYFRDQVVLLEAFKADEYDWREESTAKNWATAYNFPAAKKGRVIKEMIPERGRGLMVGFIFNQRRARFQDPRLRRAFNLAFNFEEMNRTLFFGQYKRLGSYFSGTELASSGLPKGKELEILQDVRNEVPPDVFSTTYLNPVTPGRGAHRKNLRLARNLLREAGWVVRESRLVNGKTGEVFKIEYLLNGSAFERVALRFKDALRPLGINLAVRVVDSSQYVSRLRSRDYDMIYSGWGQSLSPGNEQLEYFSSAAAARQGSRNYGGITNPAIDKLIKRIIFAKDRQELVAASKAMDRVLLWNHYLVPGWGLQASRIARWDRFGHPEKLPKYSVGFPNIWWFDETRAGKTDAAK